MYVNRRGLFFERCVSTQFNFLYQPFILYSPEKSHSCGMQRLMIAAGNTSVLFFSMANTEKSAMEMSDTIKQQCVEIDSLQERFDQEHLDRLAEAKSYQTQLQEAKHSEEETRKSCDNLKLKNNVGTFTIC